MLHVCRGESLNELNGMRCSAERPQNCSLITTQWAMQQQRHCPRNIHAPLPCVFVTDGSGFAHFVRCIHCATDILLFPIPVSPSTMPWYSHARLGCVFVTDGTTSPQYTQLPMPGPGKVKRSINSRVWIHMVLNTQCIFASKWQVLHNYGWLSCCLSQVVLAGFPRPWDWLVDVRRNT